MSEYGSHLEELHEIVAASDVKFPRKVARSV